MSASSKPAAAVGVRISTGERHGFDASAPLSTRTSQVYFPGAKEGSAIMPKLVKLVGPSSTLAEELSPCFARSAAAPSVRLRVFCLFLRLSLWRGVAACCSPSKRRFVAIISSVSSLNFYLIDRSGSSSYLSIEVFFQKLIQARYREFARPGFIMMGNGSLPSGTALLCFSAILRLTSTS